MNRIEDVVGWCMVMFDRGNKILKMIIYFLIQEER